MNFGSNYRIIISILTSDDTTKTMMYQLIDGHAEFEFVILLLI